MQEDQNDLKEQAQNVTLSMPPILVYTLENLNMKLDTELTNLFVNTLIDLSISIVKGKTLSVIDIVKLARLHKIDYSNEEYFKFLLENISITITEFATEIMHKNLENYDICIVSCFSEKVLIRKGVHYVFNN